MYRKYKIMDRNYLENLYNDNFKKIYKFFFYKSFDKQTAEDLTSETFLAFAEYLKNGKEVDNAKALLFRIGSNIFNQHLRRKYQEVNIDNENLDFYESLTNYNESVSTDESFIKLVTSYIEKLPSKQKKILFMRLIEKKSLSIIAEELEKDMNYVKTTQRRGIARIKELIEISQLKKM